MTVDELDQIAVDVGMPHTRSSRARRDELRDRRSSARIVEAILDDEHAVMPVSTVLDDFHGISGVAVVPSIVSASGAVPIRETQFSPNELGLLRRSADALREVATSLRG